jgi:hypothetical protein
VRCRPRPVRPVGQRSRRPARAAVGLFLLRPIIQFVVIYLWHEGTTDGMVESLAVAVARGTATLFRVAWRRCPGSPSAGEPERIIPTPQPWLAR